MTPISAPAPFAPPDAVIALPGKGPVQSLPPASAGAGLPASAGAGPSGAPMARPEGRNRPLRNGNPRDNPNLAPGEPARARRCHTRACHRACPGGAFDPGVDPLGAKARSGRVGAGLGSVPGHGAQSAKSDQHPMERETEGSDRVGAGLGSVPGQGAQSAKSDQDPMERETEGSDGVGAGLGLVPGAGASAKGHGPPSANTATCRACHRALVPVVRRCGWMRGWGRSPGSAGAGGAWRMCSGGMEWRAVGDDASPRAPRAPRWILAGWRSGGKSPGNGRRIGRCGPQTLTRIAARSDLSRGAGEVKKQRGRRVRMRSPGGALGQPLPSAGRCATLRAWAKTDSE
jgi:hypothetical protein